MNFKCPFFAPSRHVTASSPRMLQQLSSVSVLLLPFASILVALLFSFTWALRISLSFFLFHLLLAFVNQSYPALSQKLSALWLLHVPVLAGFAYALALVLPSAVDSVYMFVLGWAGQLLFVYEAFQLVRMTMFLTRSMIERLDDPDSSNLWKGVILAVSGLGFLLSILMWWNAYVHPALDIPIASAMSSILTLSVLSLILVFVLEKTVLSDSAVVSLLAVTFVRFGLKEHPSTLARILEEAGFFSWKSLPFIGTLVSRWTNLFTLDALLAVSLATVSLLSWPLPLDTDSFQRTISAGVEEGGNESLQHLFQSAVVLMFSQTLFATTGYLPPTHHMWRLVQGLLVVLFYLLRIYFQAVGHEHAE